MTRNPLWQSGVVDTTGTTGDAANNLDSISPVFAEHRAQALQGMQDPNVIFDDSDDDEDGPDADQPPVVADLPADADAKKKWEAHADQHGLDVDKTLSAADYKAAVRDAAEAQVSDKDVTDGEQSQVDTSGAGDGASE